MKKVTLICFFMFGFLRTLFGQSDETVRKLIKDGAFLVDVRMPGEFAQGHVKNSVNIPLNKIEKELEKFKGKKHIIVFCASGGRSMQAKRVLAKNKITNVTNGGTWEDINRL